MKKIITLILLLILTLTTACTELPEVYEDAAPYANYPEMEGLNYSYSNSSWGNEFGTIKLTFNWKTERFQWAEFEECYLEYSFDELDEYERVVPKSESEDALVTESVNILGDPDKLMPYEKKTVVADLDSYYDYYTTGFYRLAIVFKVKPYSGKSKEVVAYAEIGGEDGYAD